MPVKTRHRIIIDTNLWISFLLTSDYSKIDYLFADEMIVLLFSQELLYEFVEVAERIKFRKYFSLNDLEDLLIQMKTKAEIVAVMSVVELCRDVKHNFLLALAKDGKATHLITGDKDLLILEKTGKTKIITMSQYFQDNRIDT